MYSCLLQKVSPLKQTSTKTTTTTTSTSTTTITTLHQHHPRHHLCHVYYSIYLSESLAPHPNRYHYASLSCTSDAWPNAAANLSLISLRFSCIFELFLLSNPFGFPHLSCFGDLVIWWFVAGCHLQKKLLLTGNIFNEKFQLKNEDSICCKYAVSPYNITSSMIGVMF